MNDERKAWVELTNRLISSQSIETRKTLSESLANAKKIGESFFCEKFIEYCRANGYDWRLASPPESREMITNAVRQWDANGQKGDLSSYIDSMTKQKITHVPLKNLVFLLDKLNSTLFTTSLIEQKEEGKEDSKEKHFGYDVVTGQNENIYVSVDLYLDGTKYTLTCDKLLTIFDKRVYFAVCSIYEAGNTIMSISKIAETMGYGGRPDKKIIAKISDSLTKMRATTIYIDNSEETKITKGKRISFVQDDSMLHFYRKSVEINGILAEGALGIYTEPILLSFSKCYGQITVIPVSATKTPLRLTETTMELEDYLVQRICHIKNKPEKYFPKFMWETIFKNCGVSDKARKTKNETKEKTRVLFNHYTEIGMIEGWSEEEDGVTIKIKGTKKRKSKPTTAKSAK